MKAAMRVRGTPPGRATVDRLRKLAAGLLLCGITLVSATANAQTTLSASPTSVFVNGTVTATWSGIPAPSTSDWLGLFNPGAPSTNFYLYGSGATNGQASGSVPFGLPAAATPGTYELRLFSNGSYTLLATSNSFTVVPLPTVSGTVALSGQPISDVVFAATNGVTCTMLSNAVQYNCSVPQGWSGSVTPSRGGVSFTPTSRSYSNVQADQTAQDYAVSSTTTLSVSPTSVVVNGTVTATWSGTPGPSGSNWLGLYAPGAVSNGFNLYGAGGTNGQASGSVPFGLPAAARPGTYELRLFAGGYALLATTTITVVAPPSVAVFYIHPDHLNTPRMIADGNGTTVWRWDQGEPFGNDAPNEDPSNTGNHFDFPLRFPGQHFDRETSLNYNLFRDYDSGRGRYVESDPIGLKGGLNTYAYVYNNPLRLSDATGLAVWLCIRSVSFRFGNHSYFYDDKSKQCCGYPGWNKDHPLQDCPDRGRGPGIDTCTLISSNDDDTNRLFTCCKGKANPFTYFPTWNDCQNLTDDCIREIGMAPPRTPSGGRWMGCPTCWKGE